MPIVEIDGKMYRVDEGASEAEIRAAARRIGGKQVKLPTPSGAPPKTAEQQEVQRRVGNIRKDGRQGGFLNQMAKGFTSNFADELSGGVNAALIGIPNAIRKRDIGEVGKEYRIARDVQRADDAAYETKNRGMATTAQLVGALLSPAPKLAALNKAPALVRGAAQGGIMGALSGAGEAKELRDVPNAAAQGGAFGAGAGGVLGAATAGLRKGAQAFASQSDDAASDIAYQRVAKALSDSPRYPGSKLRHTPESAAREIAVARARGVPDAAPMDLSPEMANTSAFIRRKPGTGVQNDLYQFSEARMAGRDNSFNAAVREGVNPATGQDALARKGALKTAHTTAAKDYDKLVTDNAPLPWSQQLDDLVYTDNPHMQAAIRTAMSRVKGKDLNPVETGFKVDDAGKVIGISDKPTWRTFDLIRQSLGERAKAMRQKSPSLARDIDAKYIQLRQALGDVNPDYTDMLSKQRSVFEEEEGLQLGAEVLQNISRKSRETFQTLKELKAVKPHAFEDARTGFVEQVLNLRNQRGSPVATLRNMMGNPDQRKVLEVLFDNGSNLRRFERWLTRQSRAAYADTQVAGRQSITSEMGQMSDSAQSPSQELSSAFVHGYGFGGAVGASGNTIRLLSRFSKTMSDKALAELGRILKGDGSDLVAGVAKAKANKAARAASDRTAVRNVSRMGGYVTGTELGD